MRLPKACPGLPRPTIHHRPAPSHVQGNRSHPLAAPRGRLSGPSQYRPRLRTYGTGLAGLSRLNCCCELLHPWCSRSSGEAPARSRSSFRMVTSSPLLRFIHKWPHYGLLTDSGLRAWYGRTLAGWGLSLAGSGERTRCGPLSPTQHWLISSIVNNTHTGPAGGWGGVSCSAGGHSKDSTTCSFEAYGRSLCSCMS